MLIVDLLIGLSIFLFGMMQLEHSVEHLSSRWMKQWLGNTTGHRVSSVFAGTTITALVQSSSMVSLIVLAFASAGIMPLFNAIGVLLGANLGTTFTGWLVAMLGFKLDLQAVALPTIGLGGLLQVFGDRRERIGAAGAALFGLGLMLFGLGVIKAAVAGVAEYDDLQAMLGMNPLSYVLIGVLLATVIQSSSASMLIALTALSSGIIGLPAAAAIVIGADLGTTSTTVLGSLKGSPIKRQLALAHVLFNVVVAVVAFFVLLPFLPLLLRALHLTDPLYSLVAFHSLFNLLGLFVFVPFLSQYASWIGQHFLANGHRGQALADVPTDVPEAAFSACHAHTQKLLASSLAINLRNLHFDLAQLHLSQNAIELLKDTDAEPQSFQQRYEAIKHGEGELLHYAAQLQQQPLSDMQSRELMSLLSCVRDAVFSTKGLKDIRANLIALRHAVTPELEHFSFQYQVDLQKFYQQLVELLATDHNEAYLREQLEQISLLNEQSHTRLHQELLRHDVNHRIKAEQLSTLLNINREIWHSCQSLLQAWRQWHHIVE